LLLDGAGVMGLVLPGRICGEDSVQDADMSVKFGIDETFDLVDAGLNFVVRAVNADAALA
jgi:hypothetical protein